MLKYLYLLHLLVAASSSSSAYKILAVFPVQIKSHFKAFEPLLLELATRGHEVTVITYFPIDESLIKGIGVHRNCDSEKMQGVNMKKEFKFNKENNFNTINNNDNVPNFNDLNYVINEYSSESNDNKYRMGNDLIMADNEYNKKYKFSNIIENKHVDKINYKYNSHKRNYRNSSIHYNLNNNKNKLKNYNEIILKGDILLDAISLNLISSSRFQKYFTAKMITDISLQSCRTGLSSPEIQNLLSNQSKFDIIITEFFANNCFLSLLKFFPAPLIATSSCFLLPWTNDYFSNPNNPSYIPLVFMDYPPKMSFLERSENALLTLLNYILYEIWSVRPARGIVKDAFGFDFDLEVEAYKASVLLLNTHFSVSQSRPLVPGIVEVGGIHIGKAKKLPQNLEKWINESRDGVIYFSMGSMIKGHTFPEEKRRAFLRAFGRLGQRVLWKWENDTMPGKPDNVMIQKWMPQFDILCHPNVRAFISHGGLLGTTEAVHCGVPVVVMPQFGDQHTNARALEASGGGVVLNFRDVTEESVYNALKTVLDPKFNKQAKELSERFRDRPMPPMETAIYWIEYVARHKGAHHMRTAAVGMPFYQYLLLDVIAFLAVVILSSLYITYKVIKLVMSALCGGKKQKKMKKN